jgi:hypothetical protein
MNFSFRRPLPAATWALALGCAAFTPCQLFAQKAAPFHVDSTWKLVVLRTMPTHAKWLHEWGTRHPAGLPIPTKCRSFDSAALRSG